MSHGGVTRIDLVRHGEVATPGLFCASPDEPLSEVGWQQLSDTTERWLILAISKSCLHPAVAVQRSQNTWRQKMTSN